MSYANIKQLYRSAALRDRIEVAVANAANAILYESPGFPNHVGRMQWARMAITGAEQAAAAMMWGVVAYPDVQAGGTDALNVSDNRLQEIVNALIALFSRLSGPGPLLDFSQISGMISDEQIRDLPITKLRFPPSRLLIYYGTPQGVNGAWNDEHAAEILSRWDYLVLGAGLEVPGSVYHSSTAAIVARIRVLNPAALLFGYVDLGVSTSNLPMPSIQTAVSNWQALGVQGVFLDDAGYDYGTTRARQNEAESMIHALDLGVFINAWTAADVFAPTSHAEHNPDGAPSQLGARDFYLLESWPVNTASYSEDYPSMWDLKTRAEAALAFRSSHGSRLLAVSQVDLAAHTTEENQNFFTMSEALAACYGLDGYGVCPLHYSASSPHANLAAHFPFLANYASLLRPGVAPALNSDWTALTRHDLNLKVDYSARQVSWPVARLAGR